MLRTAEEILNKCMRPLHRLNLQKEQSVEIIQAINLAREEAILECAEKATVFHDRYRMINGKKNVSMCAVDKQSILKLLDQNK